MKQNLERVCLANFSATLFGSHVNTVIAEKSDDSDDLGSEVNRLVRSCIFDATEIPKSCNCRTELEKQVCGFVRISIRAKDPSQQLCKLLEYCGHAEWSTKCGAVEITASPASVTIGNAKANVNPPAPAPQGCDALDGDFEAVFEQLRRLKERSASCAAASKACEAKNTKTGTGCQDTPDWTNGAFKQTCKDYASKWCENGKFKAGFEHTGGSQYNFPESNCCVCGKTGNP